VVDFKTLARNSEYFPLYTRQLHAYACALEQAAPGELAWRLDYKIAVANETVGRMLRGRRMPKRKSWINCQF